MDAMETDERRDEPVLDVETYAAQFSGHAKIDRLLFIARKCKGQPLEVDALRLAADELKKTMDVARYTSVMDALRQCTGGAVEIDTYAGALAWAEQTEQRALQLQQKLENDLVSYKNNLVKESIRMGHNDLGDFHYSRGDLQNALRSYLRTRDYCTTPKHITGMCLHILRVANESQTYTHVHNYAHRARQAPGAGDDVVVLAQINAVLGLAHLHSSKYAEAASHFLKVSSELGSTYDDVIAPLEVATYGALLALATYSRKQLRAELIENIGFREFLEAAPEVREVVNDFFLARYQTCLAGLERLRPQLLLDMHLHSHVDALYKSIRSKALVQFVEPFTSLNLAHAASALNTDVPGVQRELETLISKGEVNALIDSHNGVLYARRRDQRAVTFQEAVAAAEAYIRDAKAQLLRGSLLRHDQVQKGAGVAAGGGAGGAVAGPIPVMGWRGERPERRERPAWPELQAFGDRGV